MSRHSPLLPSSLFRLGLAGRLGGGSHLCAVTAQELGIPSPTTQKAGRTTQGKLRPSRSECLPDEAWTRCSAQASQTVYHLQIDRALQPLSSVPWGLTSTKTTDFLNSEASPETHRSAKRRTVFERQANVYRNLLTGGASAQVLLRCRTLMQKMLGPIWIGKPTVSIITRLSERVVVALHSTRLPALKPLREVSLYGSSHSTFSPVLCRLILSHLLLI